MPDRIVRDELLTSERYWSVSIQAQQLYIHLLLVVDDAARFSGKNFTLRASCFPGRAIDADELERMLTELVDADLIRVYLSTGDRYIFIPRFRNRKRYFSSSKFPPPPNEINDLPEPKSSLSQPQVIPKTGGVGVGVGVGVVKRHSSKPAALKAIDSAGFQKFWSAYPRKVGKDAARKAFAARNPDAFLIEAMLSAVRAQAASEQWTESPRFIPHPSTWLIQGRWQDGETAETSPFSRGI